MTKKQYNNVIRWTLAQSDKKEDSLTIGRKIFKNLGMPFPNGDYKKVLQTLMSGKYMGWKSCTLEQARKCTEEGIPAVAMNLNRVIVITPDEAEEVVINDTENSGMAETMAMSVDEITVEDRMDMQVFAYAVMEENVVGGEAMSVQVAGRTGGSGGTIYASPRYISVCEGAKIRSTPSYQENNENVIISLDPNSVVIVPKEASICDDKYEWIKIIYFNPSTYEECEGWTALSNTLPLHSGSIPEKSAVVNSLNKTLSDKEKLTNALYIYGYLHLRSESNSWSKNAIYAMLGNMDQESHINPNFWENRKVDQDNPNAGYGLTQWSRPNTKYFDWVEKRNGQREDIDWQLNRILFEVRADHLVNMGYDSEEIKQADQWLEELHSKPISFYDFTTCNDKTPEMLSEYFLRCYENPKDVESRVQTRKNLAHKWKRLIEEMLP